MRIVSIVCLLILAGCTNNIPIRVLEPYPMFHGNSTKMWIINKVSNKGKNYSPTPLNQKDCIFFFKSEKFQMQPVSEIGMFPVKKGAFFVDMEGKILTLSSEQDKWVYQIKLLTLDKISLIPISGSDFALELIAYPAAI